MHERIPSRMYEHAGNLPVLARYLRICIHLKEGSLDGFACTWVHALRKAPQDDEQRVGSAIVQQRLQIYYSTQLLGQPSLHLVWCGSTRLVITAPPVEV